jgi:hypothetical protein
VKNAVLAEMQGILEMTHSTGIAPIPALGAVRSMPEAGTTTQQPHQDPAVDQAVIKLANALENSLQSSQLDLKSILGKVKALRGTAPMREDLLVLQHLIEQTHGLLNDLRQMAKNDFRPGSVPGH